MSGEYDDIIDMPHHVSANHHPMPMINRAAQFASFSALTGHGAAIKETARLTEELPELDSDECEVLNRTLSRIMQHGNSPKVSVTYFCQDSRKRGGVRRVATGTIDRVNEDDGTITMSGGLSISVSQIIDMAEQE
ncbi:MAG: hypothetical protein IJY31_02035 [Muribaculaceae bacterium]|nr:hypothetical protein [Muribaculaceae bacterium]